MSWVTHCPTQTVKCSPLRIPLSSYYLWSCINRDTPGNKYQEYTTHYWDSLLQDTWKPNMCPEIPWLMTAVFNQQKARPPPQVEELSGRRKIICLSTPCSSITTKPLVALSTESSVTQPFLPHVLPSSTNHRAIYSSFSFFPQRVSVFQKFFP